MAETAEVLLYIKARDEASRVLADVQNQIGLTSKQMRSAGIAITGAGALIEGGLLMTAKAALEEDINIKQLATSMSNIGVIYDDVKGSLESYISELQNKTGVADSQQREILNRLILTTGDYQKSVELLPTVLDLAAAGEMDATTAATYLGKAYLELQEGATEVSVRLGQASLQFKSLEDIQDRVRGSAENMADPFEILKASIGDIAESIGASFLPMLREIIGKFADIALKIKDWIDNNPELVKTLAIVAGAIGAALLVVGPLLIALSALPAVISGIGIAITLATGPVGLIIAAITALIAIGVLLWQNWDTVCAKAKEIWNAIADFFRGVWESIVGFFKDNWEKILAIIFPPVGIAVLIAKNWDAVKDFFKNLWDKVTGIFSDWWESIKNFLAQLNPWEWMKKGWEKITDGVKGILDNIFGHSIVNDWADDLNTFLSNYDLSSAGKGMMDTFKEGVDSGLLSTMNDIKNGLNVSDEEFNAEYDRQQDALRQRAAHLEELKASGAPVGEILKYSMTGLGMENRPEYWGEQNTQLFGAASLQDVRDLISKWVDEGVAQTMGMAQQAGYLPPGFDLEAYRRQLYDSMIAEYRRYLPGLANGGIITEPSLVYGLRSRRFISSLAEIGPELVVPTRGAGSPGTKVFEIPINIGGRRIAKVVAELIGDDLHVQRVS